MFNFNPIVLIKSIYILLRVHNYSKMFHFITSISVFFSKNFLHLFFLLLSFFIQGEPPVQLTLGEACFSERKFVEFFIKLSFLSENVSFKDPAR